MTPSRFGPRRLGLACLAPVIVVLGVRGTDGRSPSPDGGGDLAVATRPDRSSVVSDPHVAPAGGSRCGGHCADGRCGHGNARRHHPECRHGHCVPHCLVRTESFGYHGTRWRRWPGSAVVPAGAPEGATPVPAPRSTVPQADEESPDTGDDTEETGRGDPRRDATNDAAEAVRLPSVPRTDEIPAVGEPREPAGANDDGKPAGWRKLLVDGAVMPTLFTRPAPGGNPGRTAAARPTVPGRQPADASVGRGR